MPDVVKFPANLGRPCVICGHPRRAEIDAALATSPIRAVVKAFGLSFGNAQRHRANHLRNGRQARQETRGEPSSFSSTRSAAGGRPGAFQGPWRRSRAGDRPEPLEQRLPHLPRSILAALDPERKVRLRTHEEILGFVEEAAGQARAMQLAGGAQGDPRMALGGLKLALDAVNVAKSVLPPPERKTLPVLDLKIVLSDGTTLLDTNAMRQPASDGEGEL